VSTSHRHGRGAYGDEQAVWLTSEQAAKRLGLGVNTLAEWRCERRANQPPFAKFGKSVRYSLTALDNWADAQVVRCDESLTT
jgi:excisionase family DNA binding protein